ncbi:MAG: hypothetical protein AAGF11_46500 [Myxococcota bacterium]
MFVPRSSLSLALLFLLPACGSAPRPALTLPAPAALAPVAKAPPAADPYDGIELPRLGDCEDEASSADADPRCPEDIVFSAALSHLDKTTSEFDGFEFQPVEHDPDEIWTEATADAEFRGMLITADASADGVLSQAEALVLEAEVLVRWEQRTMARAD